MRLYVGVTDFDWYSHLSARSDIDEVNFWSPGGVAFKRLQPGELFLFKLKAQHGHAIVGGGIFAHDTLLPLSMAWLVFGDKNGVSSLLEMRTRIRRLQSEANRTTRDPVIGCRLLQRPFFFARDQWFRAPQAFPVNAVSGKSYGLDEQEGAALMRAVEERLPWSSRFAGEEVSLGGQVSDQQPGLAEGGRRGAPQTIMPRLGQGSFRIAVLDGFGRRCAVTGERTLPILDAAHIKPWAVGGENRPGNGVLLRTDVHRLFDLGYVTITRDHRFEVNPRLREDYENGKVYYDLHGQPLRNPKNPAFLPSADALDWHHQNRWARPGEDWEI
jgi:putative restriction endonuclease